MPQRFRLGEAALPLITASLLLIWSVLKGSTAFYWPLAAGAAVAALLAIRAGYSLATLGRAAVDGMKSTLVALIIMILVGGLIGVWKSGGTVSAMVYYGLGMTNPRFLVPAAFLLSLAVSMMLGTSIGTLSTIGVALMGVAHGVGAPLPLVAGALVSGAVFGDRSSPLSGSLNLNVAMAGTDMRRILGVLAPTGVIAAALSLGAYLWLGSRVTMASGDAGAGLRAALSAHMAMNPWLLLPPVLVLALAFLRVPVRWSLVVGMLAGAALGILIGGQGLLEPVRAALFGYHAGTGDAGLDRMLSGGGIILMAQQQVLILVAGAFNGIMEETGMMAQVISRLVEGVRRPLALAGRTMFIATAVALVAANQSLSIIVTGRMLRPAYDEAGLSRNLLSRSLADSGTVLAGVVPWNLMAIMAATAVGLPVRQWAPYAFLALFLPFVSLVFTVAEERLAANRWRQEPDETSAAVLIDKAV